MDGQETIKRTLCVIIVLAVILNTIMTCFMALLIRENSKSLNNFQKDVQALKKQIEIEIKLRQELFPKLQKSAMLLSKYNPELDYFTALSYAQKIYECSSKKVSTEVLTSLIVRESGANHKAVSSKGALGLTQVMPTVWGYDRKVLFNPYKNIEIGAQILKYYVDRYGLLGGLSAYNCGKKDFARYYAQSVLKIADQHF